MTDEAQAARKARVLADLSAGVSILKTALAHNLAQETVTKWKKEAGIVGLSASSGKRITPEKRKSIERMVRDGQSTNAIIGALNVGHGTVVKVRREMKAKTEERGAEHGQ